MLSIFGQTLNVLVRISELSCSNSDVFLSLFQKQSFKQSSLLITYYHGLTLRSFRPTSDTQYKSTPSSKIRSISWRAPRGRMGTAVPENQHLGVQQSRRKSDGTDSKPNLTATGHIEWTNILAGKPSTPDSSSWQQILILKLF